MYLIESHTPTSVGARAPDIGRTRVVGQNFACRPPTQLVKLLAGAVKISLAEYTLQSLT